IPPEGTPCGQREQAPLGTPAALRLRAAPQVGGNRIGMNLAKAAKFVPPPFPPNPLRDAAMPPVFIPGCARFPCMGQAPNGTPEPEPVNREASWVKVREGTPFLLWLG